MFKSRTDSVGGFAAVFSPGFLFLRCSQNKLSRDINCFLNKLILAICTTWCAAITKGLWRFLWWYTEALRVHTCLKTGQDSYFIFVASRQKTQCQKSSVWRKHSGAQSIPSLTFHHLHTWDTSKAPQKTFAGLNSSPLLGLCLHESAFSESNWCTNIYRLGCLHSQMCCGGSSNLCSVLLCSVWSRHVQHLFQKYVSPAVESRPEYSFLLFYNGLNICVCLLPCLSECLCTWVCDLVRRLSYQGRFPTAV